MSPAATGAADRRPAPTALSTAFDLETLAATRHGIASTAREFGLDGEALEEFTMATGEVVANAIVHGGGRGVLRLWSDGGHVRCQVSDAGPGMPADRIPPPAPAQPPLYALHGRGLWMAYQCCQIEFRSSRHGTTVELCTPVPAGAAPALGPAA